jgi:hypothetical protein
MSLPATLPEPQTETHSVGYTLGAIMLVVVMLGLAAAYGLGALVPRQQPMGTTDADHTVTVSLVGKPLHIPTAWLRSRDHKADGFASQIALQLRLPLGHNGALSPIDITLLPLSQVRPSASLLDGVYLHQFMPNELSGPAGLVGKPLYGTEGYQDETVWYDALSQNPFVAKCMAPPEPQGAARCLRTVALTNGIAAVYGFDSDVLESWRQFDAEVLSQLGRIGAI